MDRRLIPHTQRIVDAEIAQTLRERETNPQRPKGQVAISITDQQALLHLDPRRILTGEAEVFDSRPPRAR